MREKLESLSLAVLKELAKENGIKGISSMKKKDLVEALLVISEEEESSKNKKEDASAKEGRSSKTRKDNKEDKEIDKEEGAEPIGRVDGILEVLNDGYGFVRCANYLPGEDDVYVAPSQIRKLNLKTGDIIKGTKRRNNPTDKFAALQIVETVNDYPLEEAMRRSNFEDLTPVFPDERIHLEREKSSNAMRIVDLISPIGKGQRGMIVSQPKAGKTTLLKEIASSVKESNPDMHIIILLIDERPEEVTDIKEAIEGRNAEVIYSTFDELPEHHKRVSEMVIERAKRLVEHKQDVMILLDSITRLSRAYNVVHYQVVLILRHFICLSVSSELLEICVRVVLLQFLQQLLLRQEVRWMTLYSRNSREQVIWSLFLTESYQRRECSLQLTLRNLVQEEKISCLPSRSLGQ